MTKSNGNGSNATTSHISLQAKGRVGKSLVAAILSQYLASRERTGLLALRNAICI